MSGSIRAELIPAAQLGKRLNVLRSHPLKFLLSACEKALSDFSDFSAEIRRRLGAPRSISALKSAISDSRAFREMPCGGFEMAFAT